MSNPHKVKGDAAERAMVRWLTTRVGLAAERIVSGRSTDPGDITWPGSQWLLDVKDRQRWSIQAWFKEVVREAALEERVTQEVVKPLLIVKMPRERDPGEWVAVLRVKDLFETVNDERLEDGYS